MTALTKSAVRIKPKRVTRSSRFGPATVAIAGVLVLWEVTVRIGVLNADYFPSMFGTLATLFGLAFSGSFWAALGHTLLGAVLGLVIAAILAIPLGVLIGSSEWLYRAFRGPIEFLRPMPSVALIPVAVLVLGTGVESKIFLAGFAAFWPLFVQTIYGMHDTDTLVVETARSFRIRMRDRLLRIKLPAALPFMATGVRISAAVSLILAVTAELLIGAQGLGREINVARAGGAVELMYSLIIASGLLGLAMNWGMRAGERRLLSWHQSTREGGA